MSGSEGEEVGEGQIRFLQEGGISKVKAEEAYTFFLDNSVQSTTGQLSLR